MNVYSGAVLSLGWARLGTIMVLHRDMFGKRRGQFHALAGLVYAAVLLWGFVQGSASLAQRIALALVGVVLPVSAAQGFGHRGVRNVASGALDPHATVTHDEMMEHAFYQALNLWQIVLLHVSATAWFMDSASLELRLCWWLLVTAPWLLRALFPVNHFSDNYTRFDERSNWFVRLLYRLKKYQYLLYKHLLFHGLNALAALGGGALVMQPHFALYWQVLNQSYVMEFFLQTLVKKHYMAQWEMLLHNVALMSVATLAALQILPAIPLLVAALSLALNFVNRGRDFQNTAVLALLVYVAETWGVTRRGTLV